MREIFSRHKNAFIVICVILLIYVPVAISMGSLRPFAVVSSESMLPVLSRGDLILIKSSPTNSLNVGDIIVFDVPSPYDKIIPSPVIHRIVNKEVGHFETKGDNNPQPDIFDVPAGNVIGSYMGIRMPFLGHFFLFIQSPIGLAMIILLIIVWSVYSYFMAKEKKVY
ncbi:MAG: signal peptidase I [Candidatus Bathyarchaeota archaeon]